MGKKILVVEDDRVLRKVVEALKEDADGDESILDDMEIITKEEAEERKPRVNIGTIGHVDHGKKTLLHALSEINKENGDSLIHYLKAHSQDMKAYPDFEKKPRRRGQRKGTRSWD